MSFIASKKMLLVAGRLRPQDFFETIAGSSLQLDALSSSGRDLLIGKSRQNVTDWSWRDSLTGLNRTMASNRSNGQVAFSSYQEILGGGGAVLYRFRDRPKAYTRVAYRGNGVSGRQIAHRLGSVPGMVIVKAINAEQSWLVSHRSLDPGFSIFLQNTGEAFRNSTAFVDRSATAITLGSADEVNGNGIDYVAHIFAHNPNLIDCGGFTTDASGNATVVTNWPVQFLLTKPVSVPGNWLINDTVRGFAAGNDPTLFANLNNAEQAADNAGSSLSNGFSVTGYSPANAQHIHLAIRSPT